MASLCLEDPQISEAHALVSLRGQSLMLLGLRGRFRVHGKVLTEIILSEGMRIELAPGVEIECSEVCLPRTVLALEIPGLPPFILGGTTSIWIDPPRTNRGYDADADAVFWEVGSAWRVTENGHNRSVLQGDLVRIKGADIRIVSVDLRATEIARTQKGIRSELRFIANGHAVFVQREDDTGSIIGGVPGRILDGLIRSGCVAHWRAIAEHVWPGDASVEQSLRRRFDAGLARLRDRLASISDDEFLAMDGSGTVVLRLRDDDVGEATQ